MEKYVMMYEGNVLMLCYGKKTRIHKQNHHLQSCYHSGHAPQKQMQQEWVRTSILKRSFLPSITVVIWIHRCASISSNFRCNLNKRQMWAKEKKNRPMFIPHLLKDFRDLNNAQQKDPKSLNKRPKPVLFIEVFFSVLKDLCSYSASKVSSIFLT